jgi:hypothetical protein
VIDLEPQRTPLGDEEWKATVSVVDPQSGDLRPLVFDDGSRIAIAGPSESLAMSSALTFLANRFGAYSEITYGCHDVVRPRRPGVPLAIEDARPS